MLFKMKDSKRAFATVICGIIGTVLGAEGIINYFENFLNLLGYTFMPVAGVMMADYWINVKGRKENWKISAGYKVSAIIAWAVGVLMSIVIKLGLPIFNGLLIAMILYLLFEYIKKIRQSDSYLRNR